MSIKTDAKVAELEKQLASVRRDLKALEQAVSSLIAKGRKRGQAE